MEPYPLVQQNNIPRTVKERSMNPGQDNLTKAFFKDHWHHPLRRLEKNMIPIVCASLVTLCLLIIVYYYAPYLFSQETEGYPSEYTICYLILSVIMGNAIVLGSMGFKRLYQSRFTLVRLRLLRNRQKA
jgi:hypothetical protein